MNNAFLKRLEAELSNPRQFVQLLIGGEVLSLRTEQGPLARIWGPNPNPNRQFTKTQRPRQRADGD